MPTSRAPAFQVYASDELADGRLVRLSASMLGVLYAMRSREWLDGGLPDDAGAVADLLPRGVSRREVERAWSDIRPFFELVGDRLVHPDNERQRGEHAEHREKSRRGGVNSGKARAAKKTSSTEHNTKATSSKSEPDTKGASSLVEPNTNTFVLRTSNFDLQAPPEGTAAGSKPEPANGRSKRPIFTGQRFTVFEWQLDDLARMLGPSCEQFNLHEWFFALDARMVSSKEVVPQRDGGAWLQTQTLSEAKRRGLQVTTTAKNGQFSEGAGRVTPGFAESQERIRKERAEREAIIEEEKRTAGKTSAAQGQAAQTSAF